MNSWLIPDMKYIVLGTVDCSNPVEVVIDGLSGRRLPLLGIEGQLEGVLYVTVLVSEEVLRMGSPVEVVSVLGVAPDSKHYHRYLRYVESMDGWCFLKHEYCEGYVSALMYYTSWNLPTREDEPNYYYVYTLSDLPERLISMQPAEVKYIVTTYSLDVIRKLPCLCANSDVSYISEPCWQGKISGEIEDFTIFADGLYDMWLVSKNALEGCCAG